MLCLYHALFLLLSKYPEKSSTCSSCDDDKIGIPTVNIGIVESTGRDPTLDSFQALSQSQNRMQQTFPLG